MFERSRSRLNDAHVIVIESYLGENDAAILNIYHVNCFSGVKNRAVMALSMFATKAFQQNVRRSKNKADNTCFNTSIAGKNHATQV